MSDLIDRQAAIDALARMMPRSYTPDGSHPADEEIFRVQEVFADCIEALEILPSAQPATNCSEIPNGSDDTISRQAAIDVLRNRWLKTRNYEGIGEDIAEECEIYLKTLPSAQSTMGQVFDDDCVSKTSVCEILADIYPTDGEKVVAVKEVDKAYEAIQQLPSAQPDLSSYSDKLWRNGYERGKAEAEAEIIRCKNCKWFYEGKWCVRYMYALLPEDFCSYAERREE